MYANAGFLSVGLLTPQCRALFMESWKVTLGRRGAKGAPAHHRYHGVYVCTIQPVLLVSCRDKKCYAAELLNSSGGNLSAELNYSSKQ